MCRWNHLLIVFVISLLGCQAEAKVPTIAIVLEQKTEDLWELTYELDEPIASLAMFRPPNDDQSSRVHTWRPLNPDFELIHQEGNDFARRKDGGSFQSASFELTARYTSITFDYPPFQPFSDGGLLIFVGRFTACPKGCNGKFKFDPIIRPKFGQAVRGSHYDMFAYIGHRIVNEHQGFRSIIDDELPGHLRSSLLAGIPKLFDYYEERLGAPPFEPTFFASWNPATPKGKDGSDGGTVQGQQVYLHFFGPSWQYKSAKATSWVPFFLAHEASHLFQQSPYLKPNEAWIKEGAAEAMATLVSKDLGTWTEQQEGDYVRKAINNCATALNEAPLPKHADLGKFRPYYDCGLVMFLAVDASMRQSSAGASNIFKLWQAFREAVQAGAAATNEGIFHVFADHVDPDVVTFVRTLATRQVDDPKAFIKDGLLSSGYELPTASNQALEN